VGIVSTCAVISFMKKGPYKYKKTHGSEDLALGGLVYFIFLGSSSRGDKLIKALFYPSGKPNEGSI